MKYLNFHAPTGCAQNFHIRYIIFLVCICFLHTPLLYGQTSTEIEAFYSIYPKEKLVNEIKKQARKAMVANQIEAEVIDARLAR